MPLHFGKVFAAIALVTIAAFILWMIATAFFATEEADQQIEQGQAITLDGVYLG
jgi:hypothetical protein